MNRSRLKELLKVNLLFANPQQTSQMRKKGRSGAKLIRSILRQYVFSGALFLFIYGLTMVAVDFNKLPGFFTYYVALFGMLGFSQGISAIYNVFFASQDLVHFLPLPFRQSEIFLTKIVVVFLAVGPFVLPLLLLFFLTGMRAGVFPLLVVIFSCLLFLIFLAILFSLCSFIVLGLTRTSLFKKHKQIVLTLLLVISMLVTVVGILVINQQVSGDISSDRSVISAFLPFYQAAARPFSLKGLLCLLGLLLLAGACLLAVTKGLLPKLYEQLLDTTEFSVVKKRKSRENQNLHQLLTHYNSMLIRNPSLLMQMFSTSILMPLIFIMTFSFNSQMSLDNLPVLYLGVVFVAGIALATMMINPTSFVANLISLDQENFSYVRSLPILMSVYLREKFFFAYKIHALVNGVVALVLGLFLHLPLLHLVSLIIGTLLGSYFLCLRYFTRDHRMLYLNWTEISQLFSRGAGNFGVAASIMGSVFGSMIILFAYGFCVPLAPLWINLGVMLVLVASGVWCYYHYQKTFWHKI